MNRPYTPSNYETDAEKLQLAINDLSKRENEEFVVHTLCCTYAVFRNNLAVTYKRKYGRRLTEDIKEVTSNLQRKVLQNVLKPPHEFLPECARNAIKQIPKTLKHLIVLILTDKMRFGVDYCHQLNITELLPETVDDNLRALLDGLINKGFVVGDYPDTGIEEDANKLLKDMSGDTLVELLITTHTRRVGAILEQVEKQKGKSIEELISSVMPESDLRKAVILIGEFGKCPADFQVNLYREYIENGDDESLSELLILQRGSDMEEIQMKYEQKFGEKICAGDDVRFGSAMVTLATTYLPYMCIMCDYMKE